MWRFCCCNKFLNKVQSNLIESYQIEYVETSETWWWVASGTVRPLKLLETLALFLRRLLLLWCLPGAFVGPGGTAQSSGRSGSQQSGSGGGARPPTYRHNHCITHQCFPPLFPSSALHPCLPPPSPPSLPSSQAKLEGWFPSLLPYRHLAAEFVVAKLLRLWFDDQRVGIVSVSLLLGSGAPPDCSSTLPAETGKEQKEVNQRKLPISALPRLKSVYSRVRWQTCEYAAK